ncbi:ATP-binding protein [Halomonas sp. H10-9-1]|uniref:AAA family ATPase n=1 Tax=Halomonas sp. H10-9-1 TaxID=2950871 RepID=UPI0032DEACDB
MIQTLQFSNFYSFRDDAEVSFEVGRQPAASQYDLSYADGSRGNKVLAVVGANGSGKTQFLKPLAFLSWFVADSFLNTEPKVRIPFRPHALSPEEPTCFELSFELDEEHYRYRLEINQHHVLHESLHLKTSRLYSYVFVREREEEGYTVKQKGFGFRSTQARQVRGNVSLLAAAHMHDVPLATSMVEYFRGFSYNLQVTGRAHYDHARLLNSALFFQDHPAMHRRASDLLCRLDLGLEDVELEEVEISGGGEHDVEGPLYMPMGIHRSAAGSFRLPFLDESSGTQSAYVLLHRILPVLEHGGIAVIDELDNDLHPHMLEAFLDLFRFEHSNPHQAQLIFSCHTSEVFNLLAKHQVYLVEKRDLDSEAWRLDDMVGLRADDNLYAKYQSGALGAVPEI